MAANTSQWYKLPKNMKQKCIMALIAISNELQTPVNSQLQEENAKLKTEITDLRKKLSSFKQTERQPITETPKTKAKSRAKPRITPSEIQTQTQVPPVIPTPTVTPIREITDNTEETNDQDTDTDTDTESDGSIPEPVKYITHVKKNGGKIRYAVFADRSVFTLKDGVPLALVGEYDEKKKTIIRV